MGQKEIAESESDECPRSVPVRSVTHRLPALTDLGGFTPTNVAKGLILFSSAGLILGYVFWKSGVETAMVAHASGLLLGWLYWSVVKAVTAGSP